MYADRYDVSLRMKECRRSVALLLVLLIAVPVTLAQVPSAEQPVTPAQAAAAPKLEVSTSVWDFGQKWAGEKAETTITLRNVGDAPLRIEKVKTSCGCTAASMKKKLLEPGESEEVKITYSTKKRVAKVSRRQVIVLGSV